MNDTTPTASGDMAATTSSAGTSPVTTTDSTGSAAPAIQATDANPITDSTSTGEPPKERWADILENTRKKEREAALQEWRQQYGWAESVPREQLEQMATFYGSYQDNPAEWLEKAYQEALAHPIHGVTVKSRVGKMLASLRAQATAQPEKIEPGIPVMNERGEIVAKTYTDAQLEQLLQQKLDQALNPFKEDLETRKTQAQRAEEQARAHAQADQDIAYVKAMPMFEEHKADILSVFKANPRMSLRQAYDEVLKTKIFPSIGQKSEAKVLSDLQQKAAAQTVNPGTPGTSAKPKFKSFADAARYYSEHPDEAAAAAAQ